MSTGSFSPLEVVTARGTGVPARGTYRSFRLAHQEATEFLLGDRVKSASRRPEPAALGSPSNVASVSSDRKAKKVLTKAYPAG